MDLSSDIWSFGIVLTRCSPGSVYLGARLRNCSPLQSGQVIEPLYSAWDAHCSAIGLGLERTLPIMCIVWLVAPIIPDTP